jgi:serine/threonine protein kinase
MYLRQTTSALKHAWSVAVYHGDINPSNLLLDARRNIKLANLGVPRIAGLRSARSGEGPSVPGFVRSGPDYAAPEQLDNPGLVNSATDMYSLGAAFYHISFGVPPFRPPEGGDVVAYRRGNPVPSFSLGRQEVFSGKYLRLIHDMLECEPGRRPVDPEALEERLEKFHTADAEEALARSVRQVAVPQVVGGGEGGRGSVRTVTMPSAFIGERTFSLGRRASCGVPGRNMGWLWLAMGAAAAAIAGYALSM